MFKSETTTEIAKALSAFQGKLVAVKKDATNPFFKSKYASLDMIWDTIRKPLSENGLSLTQTLDFCEDKSLLETTLLHTSGEWIGGKQLVSPIKADPQSLGSAISYARRYSLSAILGLVADEDDDAEAASEHEKSPTTSKKSTPKPAPAETTQEQVDKIMALAAEKDISNERLFAHVWKNYQKQSLTTLTPDEVKKVIQGLNKLPDKGSLVEEAKRMGAVEGE